MSIQPRSPRALRAELLLGAAVGTAALLTAPAALAQAAQAANSVVSIDEIVVTAQKRAENVQDVPLAITAVRGETLAAMNITQPQQLSLIDPSVRFVTLVWASMRPLRMT